MIRIAWCMLVGDKGKYATLVAGLAFAVLLIAQQASIFFGLMTRATGVIQNVTQPDLWVADENLRWIAEYRPLRDVDLFRVRSVPGVAWAEPFFSSFAVVDLPDGTFKQVYIYGVDRATLVGQPPEMTEGSLDDLRLPDAVIVDESGREKLGGLKIGDTLKLNDRRAAVVGFCRAKLGFESNIILWSTYENAINYAPTFRNKMSFILVKAKPDASVEEVADRINRIQDLKAWTREGIRWLTFDFVIKETGIGINFGITVILGFVVGLVVSASIFYQFTIENLRHFAVMRAMGARTRTLIAMVLFQALVAGLIGYGIGVGLAGAFSLTGRRPGSELAPIFPWQLMLGSFVAVLLCVALGSILSLRRVIRLEPAVVFK